MKACEHETRAGIDRTSHPERGESVPCSREDTRSPLSPLYCSKGSGKRGCHVTDLTLGGSHQGSRAEPRYDRARKY